jgi:uncharacterized protein (TIGR00369 family)
MTTSGKRPTKKFKNCCGKIDILLPSSQMANAKPTADHAVPKLRQRTVSWSDPVEAMAAGRGLTGYEVLTAMAAGRIPAPPAIQLLGIQLDVIREGHVEMLLDPAEYLYNTIGTVHGGILATLLDSVMGCAVLTKLDAASGHTTLDIHVNFVRPATITAGRLRGIGQVLHLGSRTATAEGRLVDAEDRLYGHATTTCLLTARAGVS